MEGAESSIMAFSRGRYRQDVHGPLNPASAVEFNGDSKSSMDAEAFALECHLSVDATVVIGECCGNDVQRCICGRIWRGTLGADLE
jgi:hypothetical protein